MRHFMQSARIVIVTFIGLAAHAAAQPRDIVFTCNRDGASNICVMNPFGTDVRQLTFDKDEIADNLAPRWSHDHLKIAFHRRSHNRSDIYTMNADGSELHPLTMSDHDRLYRNPAWSPDGSRLAIDCGTQRVSDICLVAADGLGMRRITDANVTGGSSGFADWSPDGIRSHFNPTVMASHLDRAAFAASTFTRWMPMAQMSSG